MVESNSFNKIFSDHEKSVLRSYDSPYNSNNFDQNFEGSDKYTHEDKEKKSDYANLAHTKGTTSSIKVEVYPNASNEGYATIYHLDIK